MPLPFTYILLHQNRGSTDNKDCACEFDGDGDLKEANPACPVQGHRYSLCCMHHCCRLRPLSSQRGRGVEQFPVKPDVLENGSGSVRTVAWSFDAKLLASGGSDMRIILWDAKKGECLTELKGHR